MYINQSYNETNSHRKIAIFFNLLNKNMDDMSSTKTICIQPVS